MLNSKLVSTKELVATVYRDGGYTTEVSYSDCIEWTAECLDLIAAPQGYVRKVTDVNNPVIIENYRGKIPADLVQIIQTAKLDNSYPQSSMVGTVLDFTQGHVISAPQYSVGCKIIPMRYATDTFNLGLHCNDCIDTLVDSDYTYELNNDYIFANFKTGKVLFSYLGYPIDCDGFPMIPDNIKFKQAVKAYLMERIDYKLWRKGELSAAVYNKSEVERLWYIGAAQTQAQIPSIDQAESWKNRMVKLLPEFNAQSNFFRRGSNQEQLRNI
jgi:hypothetical protein